MEYHMHLVSDSTGETVSSVARSAMAQFDVEGIIEHDWALIRTPKQMEKVLKAIEEEPGIVLFTIVDERLKTMLQDFCQEQNLPCVPILNRVIRELSAFLGAETTSVVGAQHELDEDYFERVEAIHFALAHDDGQLTDELDLADVIVLGVSRTSKTPTCVYLSYRGLKAANIPIVPGMLLPEHIYELKRPLVVGLVINPERLLQIRKSRLLQLHEDRETDYVDIEKIKEEVTEARKLFSKNKWPVIDVTRKSVEETCATIVKLCQKHQRARKTQGGGE